MRQLLLLLMVFFIGGCVSHVKVLELKPNTKSSNLSISIQTPNSIPSEPWEAWRVYTEYDIQLWRRIPNMMSENVRITVRVPPENQNVNFLLDKKKSDDLERTRALPISEWEKKNISGKGVTYNKHYVDYIGGLKCTTNAESSSPALGVGFKKYYTVCGYYDTSGNKKRIDIMYHYISSFNGTKFQSDTTSTVASSKDIEALFKQDMKAIFDSLVIHDMDRTRMQKAGLLHNRVYDVDIEYRVNNNIGR